MDVATLLLLGAAAFAIGWALALWRGRVDRAVVGRGLLHGLVVAGAVLAIVAVVIAVLFNGREFLGGRLDLPTAAGFGLLVGAILGAAYFLAGATVMPFGLLVRPSRDWALYGTWVAVIVLVVSLGLGWTTYTAFQRASNSGPAPAATP